MKRRLGLAVVVVAAVLVGATTLPVTPTSGQTGCADKQTAITADEIRVVDTIDSFFFDEQTRLRSRLLDSYTADTVTPTADGTTVVSGEAHAVSSPGKSGLTPAILIGVIVVILLAGVSGWFYQRRPTDANDTPEIGSIDGEKNTEGESNNTGGDNAGGGGSDDPADNNVEDSS